jgi:hypothetical protein
MTFRLLLFLWVCVCLLASVSSLIVVPILYLRLQYSTVFIAALIPAAQSAHRVLQLDRYARIRTSRFSAVRWFYQSSVLLWFAYKVTRVHRALPAVQEMHDPMPGSRAILDEILRAGPDTYQKKESNVIQIQSLLSLVTSLVAEAGAAAVVDIGAGKALFTRAVFEVCTHVRVIAYDNRAGSSKDEFYDPLDETSSETSSETRYRRVVADVKDLSSSVITHLPDAGGCIVITKHLCGGATDSSLQTILSPPLNSHVKGVVLAPCCHQKTKRGDYINTRYLNAVGFCNTHVGVRGGKQDADWTTFMKLLSMSKNNSATVTKLQDFEYSKSPVLKLLGFAQCRSLGVKVRRILEEGRRLKLVEAGFSNARIVSYVPSSVTCDNLCIIATRGSCGECSDE